MSLEGLNFTCSRISFNQIPRMQLTEDVGVTHLLCHTEVLQEGGAVSGDRRPMRCRD